MNQMAKSRDALRLCLNKHRWETSQYRKYIGNKIIYNLENIPKIDYYCVNICRNYYAKLKKKQDLNPTFFELLEVDYDALTKGDETAFIPPQTFMLLDHQGLIQDHRNVPIIYYLPRDSRKKKKLQATYDTGSKLNY